MNEKIIKPEWQLLSIYNEITKFCLRNKSNLKITVDGLEHKPIVDIAVPDKKEWEVHIHLEITEKDEVKP